MPVLSRAGFTLYHVTATGQARSRENFNNNVKINNPDGSTSKVSARKSEDCVQGM
jgi:hypothetical protein